MSKFNEYIAVYKSLALKHNLNWDLVVNSNGLIENENAWDLSEISGSIDRQRIRLNNFSIHRFYRNYCVSQAIDLKINKINDQWQDLIKAYCIEKLIIDKIKASSIQTSIMQPLQILGSFLHDKDPESITSSDVASICECVNV